MAVVEALELIHEVRIAPRRFFVEVLFPLLGHARLLLADEPLYGGAVSHDEGRFQLFFGEDAGARFERKIAGRFPKNPVIVVRNLADGGVALKGAPQHPRFRAN